MTPVIEVPFPCLCLQRYNLEGLLAIWQTSTLLLHHMVRLSGVLDRGVDVERERRLQLPPTNNRQGRWNSFDASRESGSGSGRRTNTNRPIPNNRNNHAISGKKQQSNFARGLKHNPIEHANGVGRDRRVPVSTSQVRNQERLRPKLLSTIPRIIKQESIEMEPLLLSDSVSKSSILPLSSRKDSNRIDANTIRTDITMGTQVINHRNSTSHRESRHAPPRQYNDVHIDDDEGDIVCCEDSFRHEGTKNICTIFIWAALIFFIVNRFFLHMSMYLHRGEETKVVVVGNNFTSPGQS